MVMTMAEDRAQTKAVVTDNSVKPPTMVMHLGPSRQAPSSKKQTQSRTAVRYRIKPALTLVPKILAKSLLPSPQPRKIPPLSCHMKL
jgi:hypothetical protein